MEYINGIYNSKENIELKTALLDAERTRKPVTFYTRTRSMIDKFTCRDYENKPITLDRFTVSGGLVYYKRSAYDWQTISTDDITKIIIGGGADEKNLY